jgi:large subunit ribosomal protein L4
MPKAPLYSPAGEKIGMIELPSEIFGHKPKSHVLWEAVRMYLANMRKGTHKTKTRGEIRGSGAKIWPQKGLGRARHGDRYAPIFVGGSKAHGPKVRDYRYSLPKKVKRLAFLHALSDRARYSRILVFQGFEFEEPKTRKMAELLKKVGLESKKVLILSHEYEKNLFLSGRNIPNLELKTAKDANAYDVLKADYLILDERGIDVIRERVL